MTLCGFWQLTQIKWRFDLDPPGTTDEKESADRYGGESQESGPEAQLAHQEIELRLVDWMADLGGRQREVVERRYGLNGRDAATLEVIAADLGVTRERVRQIQIEALKCLRGRLARDGVWRDSVF